MLGYLCQTAEHLSFQLVIRMSNETSDEGYSSCFDYLPREVLVVLADLAEATSSDSLEFDLGFLDAGNEVVNAIDVHDFLG